MTQLLEVSGMDGKAAMIKKIQWAIVETPETKNNGKF